MAFTNLASKLILNDKQINAGPLSNGFPFIKFAWTVEIQVGEEGEAKGIASTGPLVAKTCELPRFSIDTQVVNAYNHKTIVQTKMNYEPITMTFYDQTNGTAESLIWNYVKGQFDSSDASKLPGTLPLTIIITLKNLSGEGDEDKVYTLKNAYIVDAQHDTLDYSTSDPVLWTLTLRYEDLEVAGVKDLEFAGPNKGDGGAGIKALPKPPSKPVVGKLPDPPPVTKPPKSDAKEEAPYNNEWSDPMGTTDAYHIMNAAQGTKEAPKKTQQWPAGAAADQSTFTNVDAMGNYTGYESAFVPTASSNPSPSTGAPKTKVQSPVTAQQAANARAAYARTDPRRLDGDGYNPAYKEAYATEYAKQTSKIPENASPRRRELYEQDAAKEADRKARDVAPKYSSQVRTYEADGSFTDRNTLYQPSSVNNPATAAAQQSKEIKPLSKNGDY